MDNISAFDRLENLRFSSYEINTLLSSLKNTLPAAMGPKIQAMTKKFTDLSEKWTHLCEELVDEAELQKSFTNDIMKKEKQLKAQEKVKNYTRQKQLEVKETEIDRKEKEFEKSIHSVKEILRKNVDSLEESIREKNHKKKIREKEQQSELHEVESEMSTVLEKPLNIDKSIDMPKIYLNDDSEILENLSMIEHKGPILSVNVSLLSEANVSEEFNKLIDELHKDNPSFIDQSGISMDKSIGG